MRCPNAVQDVTIVCDPLSFLSVSCATARGLNFRRLPPTIANEADSAHIRSQRLTHAKLRSCVTGGRLDTIPAVANGAVYVNSWDCKL